MLFSLPLEQFQVKDALLMVVRLRGARAGELTSMCRFHFVMAFPLRRPMLLKALITM
jgi:hypothetical protein